MTEAKDFRADALALWRKVPHNVRYGAEALLTRLLVAAALAFLALRILEAEGYMETLRGNIAAVELPLIDTSFKITTVSLPIDEAVFFAVAALVGGAAFSPWRAPSLVFALASGAVLFVGFPYIHLSTNFLRRIPVLADTIPEDFRTHGREPPFLTVLLVSAAFLVVVLFALAEGSRLLRRAYEERGIDVADARRLGVLQVAAMGAVGLGSIVLALLLAAFLALVRSPLRDVPMPRVNPVLGFLVMGVFLAIGIIAFAWKPAPAQDPRTALDGLKMSLKREEQTEK